MKHCCKKDFIFVLALSNIYGKKMDILFGNATSGPGLVVSVAGPRL